MRFHNITIYWSRRSENICDRRKTCAHNEIHSLTTVRLFDAKKYLKRV